MPPRPQPHKVATARVSPNDATDQGLEDDERLSPNPTPGRGAAADPGPEDGPPHPTRAPRKKDPKLDLDLLEAEGGFNDIWHKMAPAFKATFQGEGHEVADLRRLLELYQRWQMRFYPHCDFDTFVLKLEKAGRSKVVKSKMNSMRQNLLGLIFPSAVDEAIDTPPPNTQQQQAPPTAPARPAAPPAAPATAAAAGAGDAMLCGDDDDDELEEALRKEAEWEAAYAAMDELEASAQQPQRPTATAQAAAGLGAAAAAAATVPAVAPVTMDVDPDLEELMALAEEAHERQPQETTTTMAQKQQQQQPQGEAQIAGRGSVEAGSTGPSYDKPDAELIALAMEENDTVAAAGLSGESGAAAAAEPQVGSAFVDEDEELRQLAAMDTVEAGAAARVLLRWGRAVGPGRSAAEGGGGEAAPMDVDGKLMAGGDGAQQNGSTAELDEELIALAATGTLGGGSSIAEEAAAAGEQQFGGTAQLDEELMALAAASSTQVTGGMLYGIHDVGLGRPSTIVELCGSNGTNDAGGDGFGAPGLDQPAAGQEAVGLDGARGAGVSTLGSVVERQVEEGGGGDGGGAPWLGESPAVEVEVSVEEDSQGAGVLLRGILMTQETQQSQ